MSMMQDNDDDLPQSASEVSKALREALAREDISDLELFFRCNRIRNLQRLQALDRDDQAGLLSRAMQFWESLGFARNLLNPALTRLLSSASATTSKIVPQAVPVRHNKHGSNSSSSSQFWQRPLQAGEVGGSDHHHQCRRLPAAAPDESKLTRDLPDLMWDVRNIVGVSRYNDVISRLNNSNVQISSAVLEAASALSALNIRKDELQRLDKDKREILKQAKKALRDVIIWRCFGVALGFNFDSRGAESLNQYFERFCHQAACGDDAVSQLANAHKKFKEHLMEEFSTHQTASNPERAESPARKLKQQPAATLATLTGSVHAGPIASPKEDSSSTSHIRAPGYQSPQKKTCPASEEPKKQPFHSHVSGSVPCETDDDGMLLFGSKALPVRLVHVLISTLIEDIDNVKSDASSEDAAQITYWLGKLFASSYKQHISNDCYPLAQTAFMRTLNRVRTDSCNLRLVLKALALLTGVEFLHLPFAEMAISGYTGAANAGQTIDETLIVGVSEIWAWLLSEPERINTFELKQDFKAKQDQLQQVLELTFALPDFLGTIDLKKDAARFCCQALGSLKLIIKDSLDLVQCSCNWIIDTVADFISHPDVVHEGLASLVAIIQERSEVFGIDVVSLRSLTMRALVKAEDNDASHSHVSASKSEATQSTSSSANAHLEDNRYMFIVKWGGEEYLTCFVSFLIMS